MYTFRDFGAFSLRSLAPSHYLIDHGLTRFGVLLFAYAKRRRTIASSLARSAASQPARTGVRSGSVRPSSQLSRNRQSESQQRNAPHPGERARRAPARTQRLTARRGYAPIYAETSLDDPRMSQVRAVIKIILNSNEPRGAIAHDRYWNVVMANAAFVRFLTLILGSAPPNLVPLQLATPPCVNLLHLLFDPNSLRRVIVNWEACAKALLNEAYRRLAWARDDMLKALIADILKYPGVPARWREPELEAPQALFLPMKLNLDGKMARMFSTVTTVATPHAVTLQELHVEVSIRPTRKLRRCSKPMRNTLRLHQRRERAAEPPR
jgi:hypothetical protein